MRPKRRQLRRQTQLATVIAQAVLEETQQTANQLAFSQQLATATPTPALAVPPAG